MTGAQQIIAPDDARSWSLPRLDAALAIDAQQRCPQSHLRAARFTDEETHSNALVSRSAHGNVQLRLEIAPICEREQEATLANEIATIDAQCLIILN